MFSAILGPTDSFRQNFPKFFFRGSGENLFETLHFGKIKFLGSPWAFELEIRARTRAWKPGPIVGHTLNEALELYSLGCFSGASSKVWAELRFWAKACKAETQGELGLS